MARAGRRWDEDEDDGVERRASRRRQSIGDWLEDEMDGDAPRKRKSRRRDDEDRRFDAITTAIGALEEKLEHTGSGVSASRSPRRARARHDDNELADIIAQITNQQDALDTQYEGQNIANIQRLQNQVKDLRAVVDAATRGSSLPGLTTDINGLARQLLQQQQVLNAPGFNPAMLQAAPQHYGQQDFAASIDQQLRALTDRIGMAPIVAPQAPQHMQAPVQDDMLNAVHQQMANLNRKLSGANERGNDGIDALRRDVQSLRQTVRQPTDNRAMQGLEAEIRALNRKLGEGGGATGGSRDIQELKTRIDHLGRSVNESGFNQNNRYLHSQFQELNEKIARVQRPVLPDRLVEDVRSQLADATRKIVPLSIQDAKTLEKNIQFLAERLDSLRARSPDNARLQSLETHVSRLSGQLTEADRMFGGLGRLETTLNAFVAKAGTEGGAVNAFDPKSASILRGFQKQIEDVKQATDASDKRMHQALSAIHEVMAKVAERGPAPAQRAAEKSSSGFGSRNDAAATAEPKSAMAAAREAAARASQLQSEPGLGQEDSINAITQEREQRRINAARSAAAAASATRDLEANFVRATQGAVQGANVNTQLRADARANTGSVADFNDAIAGDTVVPFSRKLKRYTSQLMQAAAGVVLLIGVYNMLGPLMSDKETATASVPSVMDEARQAMEASPKARNAPYIPQVPGLNEVAPLQEVASLNPAVQPQALAINLPPFPEGLTSTKLRTAAQNGDPRALFEIGNRLIEGRGGVAANPAQAVIWLKLAAERKHAPSLYRLAALYQKGRGVTKDVPQALQYFAQAGDLGSRRALHNLAVLYASGIEGQPSFEKAFGLFKRAAELGLVDSQFNLASLYMTGSGAKQSATDAYKWFAIAAQNGDTESAKKRDEIGAKFDGKTLVNARLAAQSFKPVALDPSANEEVIPPSVWEEPTNTSSFGNFPSTPEQVAATGSGLNIPLPQASPNKPAARKR